MQDDDRMTVIEEKLAHLERYVGDLDEVLRELSKRLDVHGQGVSMVRKLLEDHLSDGGDPGDEKPPHW
ncbi:MAG: SlyX family protein [Phycisphaeraceae bacterium]